ncbi:DUF3800 domain-containing protein [Bifidobacterium pseudolongum]|uniref:DUF3800 domain-containing protein n=1 Tax=Bifidobacterium pseudolongum TaxID=1694 RepID=UPI00399411A6
MVDNGIGGGDDRIHDRHDDTLPEHVCDAGIDTKSEYWCYLDETGTPDFDPDSTPYFAFGSAVFEGGHGQALMHTLHVRACRAGVQNGFHASHDSTDTKTAFFECIRDMDVKFYATFMAKCNAYDYVKEHGDLWLYKYTLYRHAWSVIAHVWDGKSDITVHLVVAKINLSRREREVKEAVEDVRRQLNQKNITVLAHIWDSNSSAGLQIADYGLWALQRMIVSGKPGHYNRYIKDKVGHPIWYPWYRAEEN